MRRALLWLPLLYTLGATAFLVFWPVSQGKTTTLGSPGLIIDQTELRLNLLELQGFEVLLPLSLPLLVAAFPVLVRNPRFRRPVHAASAILMSGFVVIAGFSIGFLYAPAAALLVIGILTDLVQVSDANNSA